MKFNQDFEDFYNSIYDIESPRPDFVGSCLYRDSHDILEQIYKKELCQFIYEHDTTYGKSYIQTLIKYIVEGKISVKGLNEFLYKTKSTLGESFFYADMFKKPYKGSVATMFYQSSLSSFFTDLVSFSVGSKNCGTYTNIVDFNFMLHTYIMKTKKLKNNTSVWNGVDVSKAEGYSESTKVGFQIFRYQDKQDI